MTDPEDGAQRRMAAFARDLQSTSSSTETLQHVVDSAVDLVPGCQHAAISLATSRGQISTAAATGDVPARADRMQQELGEGPCMDAAWRQDLVSVPDLTRETRWPRWGPRAVEELGLRSMVCVRLFTHDDRLGALNLFSARPGAFTDDDLDEATAVAAHAAVAMTAAHHIEGMGVAVRNRTVLGQATGLVMAQYGVSATGAFELLRRLSTEQQRKVVAVAEDLVGAHHDAVRARQQRPARRPSGPPRP